MINIITRNRQPQGYVNIKVENTLTGESYVSQPNSWVKLFQSKNIDDFLQGIKLRLQKYGKNTATLDARRVAAHNMEYRSGSNPYAIAAMVWGYGNTIPDNPRDISTLVGNFDPVVRTPIDSYTYPTSDGNIIRFTSILHTTVPQYPKDSGESGTPQINEIGLVTSEIPGESNPEGYLVARYVTANPIAKGDPFIRLTAEWLYIFT